MAEKCCQSLAMSMPLWWMTSTIASVIPISGMPDRLYIIDRSGRVAYKGGRGPFGFKPGRDGAIAGDDRYSVRIAICNGRIRDENSARWGTRNALVVAGGRGNVSIVRRSRLWRLRRDGKGTGTPGTTILRIMFERKSVSKADDHLRALPRSVLERFVPPSAPAPRVVATVEQWAISARHSPNLEYRNPFCNRRRRKPSDFGPTILRPPR